MTSTIKVNNIQNQCGANIINENSNTITIGASGDTISLASGASQTGFGRTGTVDWQTSSIKTSTFTAVSGQGFFADTSSGAITMNLPAGTAGSIVSVVDYTNTFQANNLTITPNGSQKIGGSNANATLSTQGQSVTFVYVDDTEGWKNVQDSTSNVIGTAFVAATGGTVTTVCTNFKVHTFTGPGTFCVSCGGNAGGSNTVDYLVIAGGGGGGGKVIAGNYENGGGGGAGGYRESGGTSSGCYTVSPLGSSPSSVAGVTVTAQGYPIVVGGGGPGGSGSTGSAAKGTSGSTSSGLGISSAGGGGGGGNGDSYPIGNGLTGGSGGGDAGHVTSPGTPNAGNTPPVSPPQGQPSGAVTASSGSNSSGGAGGGGATAAGSNQGPTTTGGPGGAGATSSINATPTGRAGGGGAAGGSQGTGTNGGGNGGSGSGDSGTAGTTNTGGGGGGSGPGPATGANGGSGLVIIRYRFQ